MKDDGDRAIFHAFPHPPFPPFLLFNPSFRYLHQMHPLFEKGSGLTESIIGAAIEVHRNKGPGLLESIYEWCLLIEFGLRGV